MRLTKECITMLYTKVAIIICTLIPGFKNYLPFLIYHSFSNLLKQSWSKFCPLYNPTIKVEEHQNWTLFKLQSKLVGSLNIINLNNWRLITSICFKLVSIDGTYWFLFFLQRSIDDFKENYLNLSTKYTCFKYLLL